jgi:hypothetical protein
MGSLIWVFLDVGFDETVQLLDVIFRRVQETRFDALVASVLEHLLIHVKHMTTEVGEVKLGFVLSFVQKLEICCLVDLALLNQGIVHGLSICQCDLLRSL